MADDQKSKPLTEAQKELLRKYVRLHLRSVGLAVLDNNTKHIPLEVTMTDGNGNEIEKVYK